MNTINKERINGFDDYNVVHMYDNCFYSKYSFHIPYNYSSGAMTYVIDKGLPTKISNGINPDNYRNSVFFSPKLCENHSELLTSAKKLYIHPTCKLSRTLVAEKYKKVLNPWLADAIVIPEPNYDNLVYEKVALFIHESSHTIVNVVLYNSDNYNTNLFKEGNKFRDLMSCPPDDRNTAYDKSNVLDAELFYLGNVLGVGINNSYVVDIINNSLLADKIVYEQSVQDSLSSENNQLSLETLTSIKDMLNSSDEDTVSAGLKALSMMDWAHYPNSIKYILKTSNGKWRYNHATNSTSVKYMISTISTYKRRSWWPGNYDDNIYQEDYDLFLQLNMHYEKLPLEKLKNQMIYYEFMTSTNAGDMIPRIRERAV